MKKILFGLILSFLFHNYGNSNEIDIELIREKHNSYYKYLFNDDFDNRLDPKGNEYYWMVGNMVDEDATFDSDSYVVKNDYASLSPLGFNLSSLKEVEKMKKMLD